MTLWRTPSGIIFPLELIMLIYPVDTGYIRFGIKLWASNPDDELLYVGANEELTAARRKLAEELERCHPDDARLLGLREEFGRISKQITEDVNQEHAKLVAAWGKVKIEIRKD